MALRALQIGITGRNSVAGRISVLGQRKFVTLSGGAALLSSYDEGGSYWLVGFCLRHSNVIELLS